MSRLTLAGHPVRLSVVSCAPERSGVRVEVQLFTPSRELRDDWARMFAAATV